jgi:hypothetical protein
MSGHAELVRGRIIERRQDLAVDEPGGIDVGAQAIAAMHEAAYGEIPQIRCDRQVRYRGMQLAGEKALPLEDLPAIRRKGPVGQAVVVAALRVLAADCGYTLAPSQTRADGDVHESLAGVIEQSATVTATAARALQDRVFAPAEAAELVAKIQGLKAAVADLEAVSDELARGGVARAACR